MRFILFFSFLLVLISGCERPTEISPNDNIPPAVPTGLFIRYAQDGDILLQWNYGSELDLKNYYIYRSVNKGVFYLYQTTSNNYFYDDSLDYNKIYAYSISAVDNSNLESSNSDTVSASPFNKLPPTQPGRDIFLVQGINENNNISFHLIWNPNSDGDIDHYIIFRDSLSENFIPDSNKIIGTAVLPNFNDTLYLSLYKPYYFKIKAVDKGGLLSKESYPASDMILDVPKIIYPQNNTRIPYFENFLIRALSVPARYKIILQKNPYFGESWSTEISSSVINDTLQIPFNTSYIETNITYYWRVAAFTGNNTEPNSVSDLYQFILKP